MKEEKTKVEQTNEKPFFHELPQETIDQLVKEGKTVQYIVDNFRQPTWCMMPEALNFYTGCWSLNEMRANSRRSEISESFCKDCDYCSLNEKNK